MKPQTLSGTSSPESSEAAPIGSTPPPTKGATFTFNNPDVANNYETDPELVNDFQIRVPKLQYHSQFSDITPEVAEQLIKEKYNLIKLKTTQTG